MILDTTTRSIEILLGAAITTNQLKVVSDYADMTATATTGGMQSAVTNNTTPVTIISAPAASTQRKITRISVYNADTATATVTIRLNDNSTIYNIVSVQLPSGSTLSFNDEQAWSVLSSGGFIQTGTTSIFSVATTIAGINDQTGTTYTLGLSDAGKDVRCTNSSAITVTVPPNSSVAFPIGTFLFVSQGGTGAVTITAGSGVILVGVYGASTAGAGDARGLEKTDLNVWRVW